MTRTDHCRRAVSIVLVVAALILVPSMATAKFTATKAPTLTVGTDRMETPSAITGTYKCVKSGSTESIQVTVNSFTDAGPSGSTYWFGLALATDVQDVASSKTRTATLYASKRNDSAPTTWTVGIQAFLANWSSDIGQKDVTCPSNANKSGNL